MDVSLVDHEIETGDFFKTRELATAMEGAKKRGSALHLMGLLSDGQVHSSLTTFMPYCRWQRTTIWNVCSFTAFLMEETHHPRRRLCSWRTAKKIAEIGCGKSPHSSGATTLWTAINDGKRTKRAYDLLVHATGERFVDPIEAVENIL
jgi:2,3-bisphosphoglycerate-independent phosphoglycerate mutase